MSVIDQIYYDKYLLNINSLGRNNPLSTSSTDFSISLQYPIKGYVGKMRLLSATIPNVMDVFNSNNNVLQFVDSAGANSITIPPGTYTIEQLISELENLLNAASVDTYTVTFSPITLKLTITSSSALFQLDTTNLDNSPFYELGLAPNVLTAAGATQVFPRAIDLSGLKKLYIRMSNFPYQVHNVNAGVFTFVVDLTCCYGEVCFFFHQTHTDQVHFFEKNAGQKMNVTYINIQLTDEFGRPLDLKGKNWECVVEFDINKII